MLLIFFQKAKDDNISFESYATNLYQILSSSPNSLLVFYEILFELALADGILHPKEEELLKKYQEYLILNTMFIDLYMKNTLIEIETFIKF